MMLALEERQQHDVLVYQGDVNAGRTRWPYQQGLNKKRNHQRLSIQGKPEQVLGDDTPGQENAR